VDRPWEIWELDKMFLKSLCAHYRAHPASTLEQDFNEIGKGLEAGKDLLEVVPKSPFPTHNLFTALGCLIKLGVVR